MADLKGKVAVITGAASGIGLATVECFIEKGAHIVAADVQVEQGEALETRFGSNRLRFIECDVTDDDSLKAAIDLAPAAFGGLDIMFNNAGHGGTPTSIEELDLEGYDATMRLLLRSVFAGTKFAIPHMKTRGGGVVLNTSSVSAIEAGWAPVTYSVAKKGVAHFSKLAAAELAKYKIRVNAIVPGFIATSIFGASLGLSKDIANQMSAMIAQNGGPMQPIGRIGQGNDIGEMAAFLASDAAGFITGGDFLVDGGITVGPKHAWDANEAGPILDALGLTREQAEQMGQMMAAQSGSKTD